MRSITAAQLQDRVSSGENLVILDVRQQEERSESRIVGDSHFIPLGELPMRIHELDNYKQQEIIVYCRSGNRSGQACQFLEQEGFTNTVNLSGGMLKWI